MPTVETQQIFATPPSRSSAPDSITIGAGSIWVDYGDGVSSTGGGHSTIVQYDMRGQVQHTWTVDGLADGLKYDPRTGDVWVLNNNDGNANLQLINPATGQLSTPLAYAAPYVYGANSARGYDDVVFRGKDVFLSYTNPVNSGDPVIEELVNGTAPFGKLETLSVLRLGDQGINLATGKLEPLPITDPDSLKLLPNGDLLLTGEADGAYVFVKGLGTTHQTISFIKLPSGFTPDDAIMPTTSAGTFYISNQAGNDVIKAYVTGLNTQDLYADIANKNELVQIDPTTGQITPVLTGLDSPHGLSFVPATAATAKGGSGPGGIAGSSGAGGTPSVDSTHILATAPAGDSAPDSITVGAGSIWVEYGDGVSSAGGGHSTIVQYGMLGQVEYTWTADGLADGLKYDPVTGDVWVLNNNDGNSNLQLINPATEQLSTPLSYAAPYVYGANSGRGYDDVVFDGRKVFLSYTNPANPGDPVVQELLNGTAPFGKLETGNILSLGDQGTNLVTGKLETLPMTDPDSLKLLPNGDLLLTGEADGAYIFIKDPGTTHQSASFVKLPSGFTPDDAIMPTAVSGTFYISNQGANNVISAHLTGLNTNDLYADIASKNELVQIDPKTGAVTTLLTDLNAPHGLLFVPDTTHA